MKKLNLILMLMLLSMCVHAQKGRILLYGDFSYISQIRDEGGNNPERYRSALFAPGVGYGICKHYIVGLNLYYLNIRQANYLGREIESGIGVGPFVRYTCWFANYFSFQSQLNINYNIGRTREIPDEGDDDKQVGNGISANILPAFGIHPNDRWMIALGFGNIGYYASTWHPKNGNDGDDVKRKQNDFRVQFNASTLYFGIAYLFGSNKDHIPAPN